MIALYLMGYSFNIMAFIGLLMMSGIIINDSILKIDLINQLVREGVAIKMAVKQAGERRLSSILMTSISTVFAVLPIMFQEDISSQLQQPLVLVLMSGLVVGTFISIILIPWLYQLMHK